jgi:putative ATP-dependent endonuclease of the OLD family
MKIKKISIVSYRGIKERQNIPLSNLSSIVGKNDSGKSIILNAIASFLDPKEFPITESDFNDNTKPIKIACYFGADNLREQLESKIKSKIKKNDGLDEFLNDLILMMKLFLSKQSMHPRKVLTRKKFFSKIMMKQNFQCSIPNLMKNLQR